MVPYSPSVHGTVCVRHLVCEDQEEKKKNREIFKLNSKLEDERSTMYVPALRS